MATMAEILSRFKKDIKNSFQAQKNIVDVTEKYIGLLENAEGGSSSYAATVIYENDTTSAPTTIELSSAINNFDMIYIFGYRKNYPTFYASQIYMTSDLVASRNIGLFDDSMYAWFTITDNDTLTNNGTPNMIVSKIVGIKF